MAKLVKYTEPLLCPYQLNRPPYTIITSITLELPQIFDVDEGVWVWVNQPEECVRRVLKASYHPLTQ